LKYDLNGTTPGMYEYTAKACNIWGCSGTANPTMSPGAASAPLNIKLVP
jgi:hypothetical protein